MNVMSKNFSDVEVGDTVVRMLAGVVRMEMKVLLVDDEFIYTGSPDDAGWRFERNTGFEYDPEMNSGTEFGSVASFLVKED